MAVPSQPRISKMEEFGRRVLVSRLGAARKKLQVLRMRKLLVLGCILVARTSSSVHCFVTKPAIERHHMHFRALLVQIEAADCTSCLILY